MTFQEVRRRPAPFDVVQVNAGLVIEGRHLESVLLTISAVSLDGSEIDATETTGGRLIHLLMTQCRLVTPPRGAR